MTEKHEYYTARLALCDKVLADISEINVAVSEELKISPIPTDAVPTDDELIAAIGKIDARLTRLLYAASVDEAVTAIADINTFLGIVAAAKRDAEAMLSSLT